MFKDISETESATHVYVKLDKPLSLQPKWEGPFRIISRPSRSQITVKLGLIRDGSLRKQTYHWHSCKVANMRKGAEEAERPQLGRPPKFPTLTSSSPTPPVSEADLDITEDFVYAGQPPEVNNSNEEQALPVDSGAEIQNDNSRPKRSTRNPSPRYVDAISSSRYAESGWTTCGCGCGNLWSPAELNAINASDNSNFQR